MTGKQMKEWANAQHDDAVIEVERYSWTETFKIRAVTERVLDTSTFDAKEEAVEL